MLNNKLSNKLTKAITEAIISELNDNEIPEFLYHATPSCYYNSIRKYGLGGRIPRKRFWDYENTQYENITKGFFLATDEYVAASYLETSEEFEELAEQYEDRYDKELEIIVFEINTKDIDLSKLHIDTNQLLDDETDPTYFYDGIIDFKKLKKIDI